MSLAAFSTCTLSDALLKLGVTSAGHFPDIVRFSGSKICGPAYTVKMVYATDKEAPKLDQHFVDTAPSNTVIVIDAPTHTKNAVWGGLMTTGAIARNALGVVISGRCRDLAEQRSMNFPVFARGHSTVGQSPFTRPSAVNVLLEISAFDPYDAYSVASPQFPSVLVNPGDWIVGDEDGVVCVPKELEAKVVELAAELVKIDDRCMGDIKAGKGIQASFQLHRGK